MRKLFVVASSIQPREGRFTYSATRSFFTAEERFRQTIFTINSIQNIFPDAEITIIDSSDEYSEYHKIFTNYFNVNFIPIKELSGEVFEKVNTHTNKSLCECLLLNTYYQHYKKQVFEYDYIIKTCGRYFYSRMNNSLFTEANTNKIFFKHPLEFNWNNTWNYSFIDRREETKKNVLNQYCTVLYAFGKKHYQKMIDINETAIHVISQPSMHHYDIETLSYYLTRPYLNDIIEVDWRVSGWDGTSGRFMHY